MASVCVVPPCPSWPSQFRAEAAHLVRALNDLSINIEHIGSTSITGIHAKPVIDMLLMVDDVTQLDQRASALASLGYEALGEFGIPGRRYFRKDSSSGIRTHQVHAFQCGSTEALRHLAFRDYMNAHPEIAQQYSALKQQLAAAHPNDMNAYMDGKDAFIKQHQALAMAALNTP